MSSNPSSISQSNTGQISGGMQAAIGNDNQQRIQDQSASAEAGLSQANVIELLITIQKLLKDSELSEEVKNKVTNRLNAALDEVQQEKPDKQLAAGNLKRVAEVLEDTSKTLDSGKGVWERVQPILEQILGWLNVTKGFFGF